MRPPSLPLRSHLLRAEEENGTVRPCLPLHRGEEIKPQVLDGPQSIVIDQAQNKLHVHKSILAWLVGDLSSICADSRGEMTES